MHEVFELSKESWAEFRGFMLTAVPNPDLLYAID